MTAAVPPSEAAPHWARPRLERQIDMLGELAESGLDMALTVRDQTLALALDGPVEPQALESLTRAHGRAARAVRLTCMLQERVIKTLIAFEAGPLPAAKDEDNGPRHIVRIIVDPDHERTDRLRREAAEQLDRDDLTDLALARPIDDLAETIRHDLGLEPEGQPSNSSPIGGGGPSEGWWRGKDRPTDLADTNEAHSLASRTARTSPSTASRFPSPDGGGMEGHPAVAPPDQTGPPPPL